MVSPGGHLEMQGGRYRCFLPDPLPPKLNLSHGLIRRCEDVAHLLGQVQMGRRMMPNATVLIYGSLRREAVASSTIEDTVASPEELAIFESTGRAERGAVREVSNYASALEYGVGQVPQRPISSALIREMHEILMRDARGHDQAGRFKVAQNYIARRKTDPIEKAIFVPPPPERTSEMVTSLADYMEAGQEEPKLIQVALAHYQFETIHPFGDGNGRVGRLLIILHLMRLGLLPEPLIYPSASFERTRDEYYSRLQAVREEGEWEPWITYFLDVIAEAAKEAVDLATLLLRLQDAISQRTEDLRRADSTSRVLRAFFEDPFMTVSDVARKMGIAYNTASRAVEILVEAKILRPVTGSSFKTLYTCGPLYDLLFVGPETVREYLA